MTVWDEIDGENIAHAFNEAITIEVIPRWSKNKQCVVVI